MSVCLSGCRALVRPEQIRGREERMRRNTSAGAPSCDWLRLGRCIDCDGARGGPSGVQVGADDDFGSSEAPESRSSNPTVLHPGLRPEARVQGGWPACMVHGTEYKWEACEVLFRTIIHNRPCRRAEG